MVDNEKFGNFIRKLRKEKGLTQKELGEKLNITDKAISKWERGLSFPDITILNSLADFFEIEVAELLNGKKETKERIDVDNLIKETIEKYKNLEEKRNNKIKKIKKITGICSAIIFVVLILLQGSYLLILKRHNYEYVIDMLSYIVNEIIILSATSGIFCLFSKLKKPKIIVAILSVIFTVINLAFMINNGFDNKCIISFSNNFTNELVLKIDKNSGGIKLYKNAKVFLFAKEKEQFQYEIDGNVKKQWLTNDICALTYLDKDGKLKEYVVTYGDRGNGISYYYVTAALSGNWQVSTQYGNPTQLLADSNGITITKNEEKELFEYSDCKQFGTTAVVLYKNDVPKYVIALDENCEIDDSTGLIKKDGTITLVEVSMEQTQTESLYCMTYKNASNLSSYNVVNVGKNEYKIQNGIMYISYDGINTVEVPGDFSQMKNSYNEYNYQISEYKTFFYYIKGYNRYLVYSNDMGNNWNTVGIENNSSIQNIHFVNSDVGYMLTFNDVAMGTASGKISKTTDGGITWEAVCYGIGNENDGKVFKTSSQIKFIDENIGFLTMPITSGESCELYITKNGGNTFSKLNIAENNNYDYYHLPTQENGKIYIKITQGTDGDNGDYKIYCSNDNGNEWELLE